MLSVTEILKQHAPEELKQQFLELDKVEMNAPRETWHVGATPSGSIGITDKRPPSEFGRSICLMSGVDESFHKRAALMALAGNTARPLLTAYAETLIHNARKDAQITGLLSVLKETLSALDAANVNGLITDTIWISDHCTLFDFIAMAINDKNTPDELVKRYRLERDVPDAVERLIAAVDRYHMDDDIVLDAVADVHGAYKALQSNRGGVR